MRFLLKVTIALMVLTLLGVLALPALADDSGFGDPTPPSSGKHHRHKDKNKDQDPSTDPKADPAPPADPPVQNTDPPKKHRHHHLHFGLKRHHHKSTP